MSIFEEEMWNISDIGTSFYLIYILVNLGIVIARYVLQSLGYYTIAKRRGIKHPGLSWVPVLSVWVLGSISDQYRYVAKGQVKNKRKAMLVLSILSLIASVILYVQCFTMMFRALEYSFGSGYAAATLEETFVLDMLGAVAGLGLLSMVLIGISIALAVLQYMALYDLYGSCEPNNKVLFLVLSILFSGIMPIFVFVCRKKDAGMPPRRSAPSAYIPQQPDQQPPWRPVQNTPPQEPWDNPQQ